MVISVADNCDTAAKTEAYETVPNLTINQNTASKKPRSPIRFMINAFFAAAL